jgi:hypothetical protein
LFWSVFADADSAGAVYVTAVFAGAVNAAAVFGLARELAQRPLPEPGCHRGRGGRQVR